jgi:DNA repair protein RecN (Recombination protein N)
MLLRLRISNFAIIDALDLELNAGYSVITGETGSGKSILLNALSMLLGERADFTVIGPRTDRAVVEMECRINKKRILPFFLTNEIEIEDDIVIVRREINRSGKSRAFINDTPVNLSQLRSFSEQHVRIHSQYNNLELKNPSYQLQVLDSLAGILPSVEIYYEKYNNWQKNIQSHAALKNRWLNALKEEDFNRFQFEELQSLQLKQNDFQAIERALDELKNRDELLHLSDFLIEQLQGERQIQASLNEMIAQIERKGRGNIPLESLGERLKSVNIELKDILQELLLECDRISEIQVDPQELERKLDAYNHALRKHRKENQEDLLQVMHELGTSMEDLSGLENQVVVLEKKIQACKEELRDTAKQLHQQRLEASVKIERRLGEILRELKLPDTRLTFSLDEFPDLMEKGITRCELLFSANKGFDPVPMDKAASGGELSRLMLAMQKLLAEFSGLPALLLDEIDTGVSGDVARKMGLLLSDMGENTQLIVISHLPQVAALAQNHYKVAKISVSDNTKVEVIRLKEEDRVLELARLISGEKITDHAVQAAKELMN